MFETQGVKNVGDRYAAQGGTNTHMPGVATPRGKFMTLLPSLIMWQRADEWNPGNSENTVSNQTHSKGVGTAAFENSHADQKVSDHTATGGQFMKAQLGNEKGK